MQTTQRANDTTVPATTDEARFWKLYGGTRLMALARSLTEGEEEMLPIIARGLAQGLGLEPEAAAREAMRVVYACRDEWLHSELVLEMPPGEIARLLDRVSVEGVEHLPAPTTDKGLLLTSLHYGLYSSLLWIWLCRATAFGLIRRLTLMFVPDRERYVERVQQLVDGLAAAGLVAPNAISLVPRDAAGLASPRATRDLVDRLRAGETVFFCTDPDLLPLTDKHAVIVRLGRQQIALPGGMAWLARTTGCPLVPLALHPRAGRGYTMRFYPPAGLMQPGTPARTVPAALQHLIDQTVLVDPAHWAGWLWLPGSATEPAPNAGREFRASLPIYQPQMQSLVMST